MVDSTSLLDRAGAPAEIPTQKYALRFHGSGTSFFLIFLKNVLFTLLTFGFYLAWAKTERRKYVWQNFEFHDSISATPERERSSSRAISSSRSRI